MSAYLKEKPDLAHTVIYKKRSYHDILADELGQRYRDYRNKWDRASNCQVVQKYPLHLNFEIFYGCNLRCSMCILSIPPDKRGYTVDEKARISFEKYCEIIDEGLKHGLCSVQLNGYNEPLLLKDIERYIHYAKQAGVIDIYIVTNATLLNAQNSKQLIEAGLTQIKFSIDSIRKETYEKMRVGANFEKTMSNIDTFLQVKKSLGSVLPITRVSFIKTKENISEVDEFTDYWAKRVDYVTLQEVANPFVGTEKYERFKERFRIAGIDFKECAMPYQRLIIRNSGLVFPCCSCYAYQMPVGNIYDNSIYEIWNSNKLKELRDRINGSQDEMPSACRKCKKAI